MGLGILEIRRLYKKSVLRYLLSQTEAAMVSYLKTNNLNKVVGKIVTSWEIISASSIIKSRKIFTPLSDSYESPKEDVSINELV